MRSEAPDNNDERNETQEIERYFQAERWEGVIRQYSASDVFALRGSIHVEHTIAKLAAEKLWSRLHSEPFVHAMGAVTGNQAVQMVQAGLRAIYLSGWQVAADANLAGQTYPDMSLYPVNSGPALVRRINQAFQRADQIQHMGGKGKIDWLCPIIADAEAGFGGPLNAFELMKGMIEAGAAGVHFEDQLASEKKCGHMGGKVLVPTGQFVRTLMAARLASDTLGVPMILVARTDSRDATLMTSDFDERDREFVTSERTPEGYWRVTCGLDMAIARGLSFAPYSDMLWFETHAPDMEEASRFARAIHKLYPEKLLAYNLSASFNWDKFLNPEEQANFMGELGKLGYKFQFVTLAGFHSLNQSMFELAEGYAREGLPAYVRLQRKEFESEAKGYAAIRHQSFAGASYFDEVLRTVSSGSASTSAMEDSTEAEQFVGAHRKVDKEDQARR